MEALQGQPGMTQTAVTQFFIGHGICACGEAVGGHTCDVKTRLCPLHLSIETPGGPALHTMPFILLPQRGDVVFVW